MKIRKLLVLQTIALMMFMVAIVLVLFGPEWLIGITVVLIGLAMIIMLRLAYTQGAVWGMENSLGDPAPLELLESRVSYLVVSNIFFKEKDGKHYLTLEKDGKVILCFTTNEDIGKAKPGQRITWGFDDEGISFIKTI